MKAASPNFGKLITVLSGYGYPDNKHAAKKVKDCGNLRLLHFVRSIFCFFHAEKRPRAVAILAMKTIKLGIRDEIHKTLDSSGPLWYYNDKPVCTTNQLAIGDRT
ncbi:MAG TPA: hypothetical protein VE136_18910 [Anaerolineales bacterium]|nr:hypothetical protein [Anaerolineales bacterium]